MRMGAIQESIDGKQKDNKSTSERKAKSCYDVDMYTWENEMFSF